MQEIIDDVFSRMQVIEDSRGTNRNQRFKAPVKGAEFLYRSTDHIYRRGWRFDPSSIPPHDSGPWPLMHLLPYFVGGGLGSDGFVFGWEPMIHINNHLATAFPLEVSDLPRELAALPHDSWYEALSPSLVWKTPFLILSELRAGPRFMTRPDHPLDPWQSPTFEAGALLLAGKLRLTAFRAPQLLGAGRSYRWLGNISLADANGIVYWLFR